MDQINFLKSLLQTLFDFIKNYIIKDERKEVLMQPEEPPEPDNGCEGISYTKLKLTQKSNEVKKYSATYEPSLIKSNQFYILEFIQLKQDSYKSTSDRSSTQILDFLGDIGGFQGAIVLILITAGQYFSAKFFIA